MEFYEMMQQTMLDGDGNISVTENGAIGFRTTGQNLLDLNFAVASLRGATDSEIIARFRRAFADDKELAMRWLFFARDVRGGLGERNLFRAAMKYVVRTNGGMVSELIPLIPEYGRYDDLWGLLDYEQTRDDVIHFVAQQLGRDLEDMENNKPISLLAKWLPSINASSNQTKRYARMIADGLGMWEREYRKTLSKLRKYLEIVEVKMSAHKWEDINYEAVPSRANVIYKDAFMRHDATRRSIYLEKLQKGEAKINSDVLYPHDIVHKYCDGSYVGNYDQALESMWKALPDMVNGAGNTIVVADGSGSMGCYTAGNSRVTALEVANSLAIYFAEHSSGEFKDKYITFSSHPVLVDLTRMRTKWRNDVKVNSLRDKIEIALSHSECANTNIEGVFDLILDTAVSHSMSQKDIPANILIISDMEFDSCASSNAGFGFGANLFAEISKKYAAAGYKLPRLVFWNVNSRTGTIPVRENELGVALVSGFSVNVCKMVMSGKLDPFECLLETIMDERYDPVGEIVEHN